MKLLKQFTISSLAASITHLVFFAITALLDKIINSELANIIGLIIDKILDFIVQQYIFMKHVSLNSHILLKYIGSEVGLIILNQLLFTLYYRNYYNEDDNLTFVRILIGVSIYTFFVFPIRKFFVYK